MVYILPALLFRPYSVFAEDEIELEPLVITSTRIEPAERAGRMPLRNQDSVLFYEKGTISHFSVPSMLKGLSLVDTRTRGPYGVQTDISLRGAPFEQNLVLIDGLSINDPKSGHHNMDLPLAVGDIERVDITYGPASSVYGSGALGGAVNIVPKEPQDKLGFSAYSAAGSWDFYSGGASLNVPLKPFKTRASVEWKRSTGYAAETEFSTLTASSYSKATFGQAEFDIFTGYLTKKFGADSFYSNLYPNEEESINTGLLITKAKWKNEEISVTPRFYLKRLQDKFILDRNRRSFSRNDHTTYLYGGELSSQVGTPLGEVAFGAGIGSEEISSTNLGDHSRVKNNAFVEYENKIQNFLVNASGRFDHYSTFGSELLPSVNIGYELLPGLVARSGVARAFRAPTFTDLYYTSVANRGNEDLEPEKAWTYEAGLNYLGKGLAVSGTVFLRSTEDAIDWTREAPSSPWRAENIGEFDMLGVEGSLEFDFRVPDATASRTLSVKYAGLDALDKKGITSKYFLEYLKHNLAIHLEYDLPFGISHELDFAFRKRRGEKEYALLDSGIYKNVEFKKGKAIFFLKFNNIFDTDYSEQGDIEMPGFAFFTGASARF